MTITLCVSQILNHLIILILPFFGYSLQNNIASRPVLILTSWGLITICAIKEGQGH
jgi:hypothetical protein